MPSATELAQKFTEPDGFKKLFGFGGGGRAKKAHELFTTADASGVTPAYTLDVRTHEGCLYYIKAISTRGDLDEATLSELTNAAQSVPLGTMRYEGMMAATLPESMASESEASDIYGLSRLNDGIFVFPLSIMSKKGDAANAAWAEKGGEHFVLPLEDKAIAKKF